MENLLDEKEAAKYLDITEDKLKELVSFKLVPAYLIAGEFRRFRKEELEVIKEMFNERMAPDAERIFHKAFKEARGIERIKEILRANDVYLIAVFLVILILSFYIFRR